MSPDDQAGLDDGGNRKSIVEVALLLKIFFAVNFEAAPHRAFRAQFLRSLGKAPRRILFLQRAYSTFPPVP